MPVCEGKPLGNEDTYVYIKVDKKMCKKRNNIYMESDEKAAYNQRLQIQGTYAALYG